MNTSKYKATTILTRGDFPPLSRHSTKTFNLKFLSITSPHENTLFSEIAHQTHDSHCNKSITKTLGQTITTGYMKSKLKRKCNTLTCIKTCPTTEQQCNITKKKNTNQKIPHFIQHHI